MASGVGGLQTLHVETDKLLNQGPDRTNPLLVPMMIPNMGAAHVSLELGTKGPLSATCTACAAASDAIGYGGRLIRDGDADVMFAGGTEAPISPVGVAGFAAARALSTHNEDPKGASRPFDVNRDGFVIGEGAGVLVLEELEHAKARGAHIYAELAGYGMSGDAYHMTLPDESGEAQARAVLGGAARGRHRPVRDRLHQRARHLDRPGDIAETRAIKQALGDHAYEVAISSNKSMIGHCLGAAGAIEAVATVLAIATASYRRRSTSHDPDPECDLDYVPLSPASPRSTSRSATASGSAATTWPWSSAGTTADRGLRAGRAGGRSTS